MVNILMNGYLGRMGRVILELSKERDDLEVIAGVDYKAPENEVFSFSTYTDYENIEVKPDVIIDFGKAAKACGIGEKGLSGKILSPVYGPFIRYCFIITDAPLEHDAPLAEPLCDNCGACREACPGRAIGENGLDTWQCSVYYKGAHRSNPFMPEDFLADHPEREAILDGEKRFDAESARAIYPKLNFLPNTQWGYAPCLCGRKCDMACYKHLKETGKI